MPTERPPLVGEVIANFADRGCHVVSVTDPYGRILGFLDMSHYFSITAKRMELNIYFMVFFPLYF
jgi:hypothetical protein